VTTAPPVVARTVQPPRATPAFRPGVLRTARAVARPVINNLLFDLHLDGVEHVPTDGPLLLAGPHSGWLDGPLVVAETPRHVRCLTKSELYAGRLGDFLHVIGQIPVERGKPDRSALQAALDELARGGAVGVFPEGTRGSGELDSVHDGLAYLASRSRAPIVPVACVGTAEALPKGARLPRHTRVDVVYGKPFLAPEPASPHSRRALAEVGEAIRVRLVEHVAAARAAHPVLAAASGRHRL